MPCRIDSTLRNPFVPHSFMWGTDKTAQRNSKSLGNMYLPTMRYLPHAEPGAFKVERPIVRLSNRIVFITDSGLSASFMSSSWEHVSRNGILKLHGLEGKMELIARCDHTSVGISPRYHRKTPKISPECTRTHANDTKRLLEVGESEERMPG